MADDLARLLPALHAIPPEKVRPTTIPVAVVLGEAYSLASAANQHRAALLAVGVAPDLIDSLGARAGALRDAQSAFLESRAVRRADARKALFRAAMSLRSDLVAAVRFALRDAPDERKRAPKLSGTPSTGRLCQDLVELVALIEKNRPAFEAIGFDFELLEKASAMSTDLRVASAASRTNSSAVESRIIRDRAYTFLTDAMAGIRLAAAFAFRNDTDDQRRAIFMRIHKPRIRIDSPVTETGIPD